MEMGSGSADGVVTTLCINGGSSSLKVALYALGGDERLLGRGQARRIGQGDATLEWGDEAKESLGDADHAEAMRRFARRMEQSASLTPDAIVHRIVHGGDAFDGPAALDSDTLAKLRSLVPLAPLHLPSGIALIEACSELWPDKQQLLCFDTTFHQSMPDVAKRLPLPRRFEQQGLRRYGFHGISFEYVLEFLGDDARGRVILAHLGAGASLAAVRDGRPIDTTMGFTPTGGLMMATRCGDIDPGVLLHFMRQGYDAAAIGALVNEQSGLLGLSGRTADMAGLERHIETDPKAREAVESFCYIARKHIGAMAAALDGLDLLVFTAGIGEHSPYIRARICDGLSYLGVRLDAPRNERNAAVISARESSCRVRIVPTNEELHIARTAYRLLRGPMYR